MLWLNALRANVRKTAVETLRYWPNTLGSLATFYTIFLLLLTGVHAVGGPGAEPSSTRYLIAVLVLWILALTAMQGAAWEVSAEAARGTLEQLYMSPVAAWSILLARMIAAVLLNLVVAAVMLALSMATARQWVRLDVVTLAPLFLLTVVGMIGVGFMLAGLALVAKQVQSIMQIVQFICFALVAVPVSLSPWLELAPAVRGASMVRTAMIDGRTAGQFAAGDWLLVAANAVTYFVAGVWAYKRAESRAMRRGLLGQY